MERLSFVEPMYHIEALERNLERILEQPLGNDNKNIEAAISHFNQNHQVQNPNRILNSTCFVFYLGPNITSDMLRTIFMTYGTVLNANVAIDKVTKRTRGFGFVDFSNASEAQAAVNGLDKYPLDGKFLSVSIKV